MFPRRRLAALALALGAVLCNALVDYGLLLRNPGELEAQARHVLRSALPDCRVSFGRTELAGTWAGKVVFRDVRLYLRGDAAARPFLEVKRVEVEGQGLPPAALWVRVVEPRATLLLDRAGGLTQPRLPEGGPGERSPGNLPEVVDLRVEGGRIFVEQETGDASRRALLTDIAGKLRLSPRAGRLEGAASLRLGALEPAQAGGGVLLSGLRGERFHEVAPALRLELERRGGGALSLSLRGPLLLGPQLRSLLPSSLQQTVWDELQPLGGELDLNARLSQGPARGHLGVSLVPRDALLKPRGLPLELHRLRSGQAELSMAWARQQAPEFLGLTWEGIEARVGPSLRVGGELLPPGRLRTRGNLFPGGDEPGRTLHLYGELRELPLSPALETALPADLRALYRRFAPQGVLPEVHLQLFQGPFARDQLELEDGRRLLGVIQSESAELVRLRDPRGQVQVIPQAIIERIERNDRPQLSLWIPRLGGRVSLRDAELPLRVEGLEGWLSVREGGNVEFDAAGTLAAGGRAGASAQILHGDVISLDAWTRELPVSPDLVQALPEDWRARLEPLAPQGGRLDAELRLERRSRGRPLRTRARLQLAEVGLTPVGFDSPLALSGEVELLPISPGDGAAPPGLALRIPELRAAGPDLEARLRGTVELPGDPAAEGFSGELTLEAERLRLNGLPSGLRARLAPLGPAQGSVVGVRAAVRGPEQFDISGRGRALRAVPAAFALPAWVEAFDLSVAGEDLRVRRLEGRLGEDGEGGRFHLEGALTQAPGAAPTALDLTLRGENVRVDPAWVAALPPDWAREAVAALRPAGRCSGTLALSLAPERSQLLVRGRVALEGLQLYLDRIHPELVALADEPVLGLRGELELEPERLVLRELRGRLAGSPLSAGGELSLLRPRGPFDVELALEELLLDERTRQLASPRVAGLLESFEVAGPLGLSLRAFRQGGPAEDAPLHVHLSALPRGLTVVPRRLPLPVRDVEGRLDFEDGRPVAIDLRGRLRPTEGASSQAWPRVHLRQARGSRPGFPTQGRGGQVFHLWVDGLERAPPVARASLEGRLPSDWLETLDALDPRGKLDLQAWIYRPWEDRALRWVAEARLRGLCLDLGPRLNEAHGLVRLEGRLEEGAPARWRGELRVEELRVAGQSVTDLTARVALREGVLRLGSSKQPGTATLYGGQLRGAGRVELSRGAYAGWLQLGGEGGAPGRLARALPELGLRAPRTAPGQVRAALAFRGVGRGPERELNGAGWLSLAGARLLGLPALGPWRRILARARAAAERDEPVGPLEELEASVTLEPQGLRLERLLTWGPGAALAAQRGRLDFEGDLRLVLIPALGEARYDANRWAPRAGYTMAGRLGDPPTRWAVERAGTQRVEAGAWRPRDPAKTWTPPAEAEKGTR